MPRLMSIPSTIMSYISKSLQYGDRGKFRRPTNRVRMGWMFPILAVLSLLMNSSLHTQRMRRGIGLVSKSNIERGPPAHARRNSKGDKTSRRVQAVVKPSSTTSRQANNNNNQARGSGGRVGSSNKAPPLQKQMVSSQPAKTNTQANKETKSSEKRVVKKKVPPVQSSEKRVVTEKVEETTVAIEATDVSTTGVSTTGSNGANEGAVAAPSETFSACLLIRDDNEILNEWIAYHYHVLRMTRLIVAVDPNSETSPKPLLDNWSELMEIDVWTDGDYMSKEFLETGLPPKKDIKVISKFKDVTDEEMMEINVHRYRQRYFLTQCLKKIKEEGRTWVGHIDTDEYIVPNKNLREEQESSVEIMPVEKPGSMLNLLQQLVQSDSREIGYPCLVMIRISFGSVESEEDKSSSLSLPPALEENSFETLRWRHHGSQLDTKKHGFPKVLIDVSKLKERHLSSDIVYSIHRPFQDICRGQGDVDYAAFKKFPIATNHYLGSWERYNARNDKRRSWSAYNEKANVDDGQDSWVEGWLKGFIDDVGEEKALHVLGEHYLKPTKTAAS